MLDEETRWGSDNHNPEAEWGIDATTYQDGSVTVDIRRRGVYVGRGEASGPDALRLAVSDARQDMRRRGVEL